MRRRPQPLPSGFIAADSLAMPSWTLYHTLSPTIKPLCTNPLNSPRARARRILASAERSMLIRATLAALGSMLPYTLMEQPLYIPFIPCPMSLTYLNELTALEVLRESQPS
jgi:hypothetical protein